MARPHWNNCIMHDDEAVGGFIREYFGAAHRKCLFVGGAGFDPRARKVAEQLGGVMGDRLSGILIREERTDAVETLRDHADDNEAAMRGLADTFMALSVRIFDPSDNAPVGGQKIVEALRQLDLPGDATDVVLDMSALSTGIAFPIARYLLTLCETRDDLNFHLMISSNPELDARIVGEPYATPSMVRGFSGPGRQGRLPVARVWLPQLAAGRMPTLQKIVAAQDSPYRICPILPFPSRNPRRADDLLSEFRELLDEGTVDARDFLYVSERNPLDTFRKLSMLKKRYDQTMDQIYQPELLLSPLGSKVMAVGAMMAAIEHDLPVQHVENVRYDYDPTRSATEEEPADVTVHVWLHGPIYAGYAAPDRV